ncbi:MAG TPA: hypothetical protein VGC95_05330, partial [Chitinophagaceae bacterium]
MSIVLAFVCLHGVCQNRYQLAIRCVDKDSGVVASLGLENGFASRTGCSDYVGKLPDLLRSKGYMSASIDSLAYDTAKARVVLYLGDPYHWASINTSRVDPSLLDAVGWKDRTFPGKTLNMDAVAAWQEKILSYLATNGRP